MGYTYLSEGASEDPVGRVTAVPSTQVTVSMSETKITS